MMQRYVKFFSHDPFHGEFFGFNPMEKKLDLLMRPSVFNAPLTHFNEWSPLSNWRELSTSPGLNVKEEPEKYTVNLDDPSVVDKNISVNYHKKENALEVTITLQTEKQEGGSSFKSSSTSTRSVSFEKPVNFSEITAKIGSQGIVISVPKTEKDEPESENLVRISIEKAPEPPVEQQKVTTGDLSDQS